MYGIVHNLRFVLRGAKGGGPGFGGIFSDNGVEREATPNELWHFLKFPLRLLSLSSVCLSIP